MRSIERAALRALDSLDPARVVRRALERERIAGRVRVVAIGKAAHVMLRGAEQAIGERIEASVVVGPEDAGHPLPDARSVAAAERCLALVGGAGDASIVVLVSGGSSALVALPCAGVSLRTKRAITRAMLGSGATVQEINTVRKHLSRIKGGGLARAARGRRVLTLVLSDVIGGTPSDVGSGPSVPDASRISDARALLRRHAPRWVNAPLVRTLANDPAGRLRARVLASPEALARAAGRELGARVLPPSQADVASLAAEYIAIARRLAPGDAIVRAAEPSIFVPPSRRSGRGGRSTHLAASVGRELPRAVVFAAIATDGVDGASGTAGAIVDASFLRRAGADAIERALATFDTGPLHLAAGSARAEGPTGHNLADLHVLLRR